jgi:hypothetical protein
MMVNYDWMVNEMWFNYPIIIVNNNNNKLIIITILIIAIQFWQLIDYITPKMYWMVDLLMIVIIMVKPSPKITT